MDPFKPFRHHEPIQVAPETFLIRQQQGEPDGAIQVAMNSLVIRGKEPVIIDTGTLANREDWLNDVFSLVDPKDVRWVILSHDDGDHTGNLRPVLELCPQATLVATSFMWERMAADIALPLDRMRWIDDGGSLDVGDRTLALVRPPIFDSPTTRGIFDSKTGLYWASDAFASPSTGEIENVAQVDRDAWEEGFFAFQRAVSPWHFMLDQAKFDRHVDRVATLDPKFIAGAHTPLISGDRVAEAIRLIRRVPALEPFAMPGQELLDSMVEAMNAQPNDALAA
jgi:flavorubredoxin